MVPTLSVANWRGKPATYGGYIFSAFSIAYGETSGFGGLTRKAAEGAAEVARGRRETASRATSQGKPHFAFAQGKFGRGTRRPHLYQKSGETVSTCPILVRRPVRFFFPVPGGVAFQASAQRAHEILSSLTLGEHACNSRYQLVPAGESVRSNILVRNVPETVRDWIDHQRQQHGMSQQEFVLSVSAPCCR